MQHQLNSIGARSLPRLIATATEGRFTFETRSANKSEPMTRQDAAERYGIPTYVAVFVGEGSKPASTMIAVLDETSTTSIQDSYWPFRLSPETRDRARAPGCEPWPSFHRPVRHRPLAGRLGSAHPQQSRSRARLPPGNAGSRAGGCVALVSDLGCSDRMAA